MNMISGGMRLSMVRKERYSRAIRCINIQSLVRSLLNCLLEKFLHLFLTSQPAAGRELFSSMAQFRSRDAE